MFYFLIFFAVWIPVIILGFKALFERKIGKKEKVISISFSIVGTALISLVLWYSDLYVKSLWFQSLGYNSVFWKKVLTQGFLFVVFAVATFLFLKLNALLLKKFLAPIMGEEVWQRIFSWVVNIVSGTTAVVVGFVSSNQWDKFLMFFNRVESGIADPIFHKDISFYLFNLPLQDYLSTLFSYLSLMVAITVAITYIVFVRPKTKNLSISGSILLIVFLGAIIWKLVLAQYHLLFGSGVVFGAGYTDIHMTLFAYRFLIIVSVLSMAALLVNVFWGSWKLVLSAFGILLISWPVLIGIAPEAYQFAVVKPNELKKEYEYIGYNIQYTRQAYGLDQIEEKGFEFEVSPEALTRDQDTLDNVRLWDPRALLNSYRQRQAFRLYYEFSNVDIDRYMIDGAYRQVMLAPRELEKEKLDPRSRTWINEKLKYTHGYGVVLNRVNEFSEEGMPNFLIRDIPPQSLVPEIKITRPEIYYGLLTRDYVIANTTEPEFDYPQGDVNIYAPYQGKGGVAMGTGFRKLALTLRFNDINILLSRHIKPDSKIMFHRQIKERVRTIAPFLKYDEDPYIVIDNQGKLWWIIDAYTVSSNYPYSEPYSQRGTNYIRNSVKAVINAYDGAVTFYVFDERDPLIQTWMNIFPELFRPKDAMPQDLLSHVRYPKTILYIQAKMYLNYHMEDIQVFYNKEDTWQIGKELYERVKPLTSTLTGPDADEFDFETRAYIEPFGSSDGTSDIDSTTSQEVLAQEIVPYYVIIRLPGNSKNEFIQMLPFTPRGKDNLTGWIAGRSDGEHYGKVLVFKFSKQVLIYGPMQFEARINQNTEISASFTLWSQSGSEVIRGNTLIIPIENSLLYVEPIYLKAEQSEMPEIKKVIVAFGDKLEWGDSFAEAIKKVMGLIAPGQNIQEVLNSAQKHLAEYQRLTGEGKLAEAGKELEALQEDLQRLHKLMSEIELAED